MKLTHKPAGFCRADRHVGRFVLQVNVGHPSEVDEIFDAISYSKGASVIRMLHNYIGDEVGGRARGPAGASNHRFKTEAFFAGL